MTLWSISGLRSGTFLLHVIVDLPGTSKDGLYETILVILRPNQNPVIVTPIFINSVTTKIVNKIDTRIVFIDKNDDDKDDDDDKKLPKDNSTKGNDTSGLPTNRDPKPVITEPKCDSNEWRRALISKCNSCIY